MSRYVWAKPNSLSHIIEFIKWLPTETSKNYYLYLLCCQRNQLELPKELWKYILYHICDNKKIEDYNLIKWYDKYFTDNNQQQNNPMYITDTITNACVLLCIKSKLDISYVLVDIQLDNTILINNEIWNTYHINWPCVGENYDSNLHICKYHPDMILGFIYDNNIQKIKISTKYHCTDEVNLQYLNFNSLFVNIIEKDGYLSIKSITNNKCLMVCKYMPIITTKSLGDNEFIFYIKSNIAIPKITILCSYINNELRTNYLEYVNKNTEFKNTRYIGNYWVPKIDLLIE